MFDVLCYGVCGCIIDHPQNGMVYNFGRFCLCVCLCVCQTITFESLHVGSSYLHIRHISRQYESSSYMKFIGLRSRSRSKKRSTTMFLSAVDSVVVVPVQFIAVNELSLKLLKRLYQHNETLFALMLWPLSETFIRRSLFSSFSSSCHNRDMMRQ